MRLLQRKSEQAPARLGLERSARNNNTQRRDLGSLLKTQITFLMLDKWAASRQKMKPGLEKWPPVENQVSDKKCI
jgi:hypothetical protein